MAKVTHIIGNIIKLFMNKNYIAFSSCGNLAKLLTYLANVNNYLFLIINEFANTELSLASLRSPPPPPL